MKGKDEREAARLKHQNDRIKLTGEKPENNSLYWLAHEQGFNAGYDAGLSARPEPPEPDGEKK